MTKLFIFVSVCFLLMSCKDQNCEQQQSTKSTVKAASAGSGSNCPAPTDPETPTQPQEPDEPSEPEEPQQPGEGVPPEAAMFDASITFNNFDADDEEKVHKAVEIIKKIVMSSEFRDRVINFSYQGAKSFVDSKGLTNEQIYQMLLDGKEDLKPEVDHEMDLELQLYYSWTSTVGYTYPDVLKIWMNTKFFNSYTPAEVAGNLFHEWTHKLGFDHASSYSVSRDSSVPYAIGYLIEELGKKYE